MIRVLAAALALALPALAFAEEADMAAAKRVGKLSWYTSTPVEAAQ